jgi:GNAT superfamily N-acetyltransferase
MTDFTIEEITIPATLDTPDAADFIATAEVRNAVEAAGYGTDDLAFSAAELLPDWLDQEYQPKRLLAARVDGRIVARAVYETQPDEDAGTAWLDVKVLPEFRRRGIGAALADRLEAIADFEGRGKRIVYAVSRDGSGARLPSPTGFGSVPRANDEVRFLLGRGYALEQVERGSRLALPPDPDDLARCQDSAASAAGPDYVEHFWIDHTPERWRRDMALLYTRMSTEAPTAGLEEPEDVWTVERLALHERRRESSPRIQFVAAVEHRATGRLAGFTELSAPAELTRPVSQEDTIVLEEHRGHRLGMLLKVANLRHLERVRPGHPAIITFNAEENRHMLDVNEAVGFRPIGYEGAWLRVV